MTVLTICIFGRSRESTWRETILKARAQRSCREPRFHHIAVITALSCSSLNGCKCVHSRVPVAFVTEIIVFLPCWIVYSVTSTFYVVRTADRVVTRWVPSFVYPVTQYQFTTTPVPHRFIYLRTLRCTFTLKIVTTLHPFFTSHRLYICSLSRYPISRILRNVISTSTVSKDFFHCDTIHISEYDLSECTKSSHKISTSTETTSFSQNCFHSNDIRSIIMILPIYEIMDFYSPFHSSCIASFCVHPRP